MKKWQIATSVVVAVVAVLSLTVAAFAQGNQPPANAPQSGYGYGRGPMGGMGYGFRFGMNGGSLVDITAEVTGLSVEQVVTQLQTGKTFADIAQAHDKTAADLVNAFLAERKAALDEAVAGGRITQDVADTMLATIKTNVEQHVDEPWEPRGMGCRFTAAGTTEPQFLGPRWTR